MGLLCIPPKHTGCGLVCCAQDEGNAAFTYVHGHGSTAGPVKFSPAQHGVAAVRDGSAANSVPAPRLSAVHIATTPPGAAGGSTASRYAATAAVQQRHAGATLLRTPAPAELSHALLGQSATPFRAAQELAAQLAVSPSVLTPSVASAMAAAGAAAAQGFSTPGGSSQAGLGGTGLDVIKAKLEALKEQINLKTKKMSADKRARVQGQIDKLEKSLEYVEQQRVSACAANAV